MKAIPKITSRHNIWTYYYQNEDKQDGNTLINVEQSQDQVTQEIEQIHTNPQTVTQTMIEHNITTEQMIQAPNDITIR